MEKQFGFTDAAFVAYMGLSNDHARDPKHYNSVATAMAEHEHPVVRYAAGWAYAERGVYAAKPGMQHVNEPSELRLNALTKAETLWTTTAPDLANLHTQIPDKTIAARAWGFWLRLLQAQAYLPNMQLIARLRSNEVVDEQSMQALQQQTKANIVTLGALLLNRRQRADREKTLVLSGITNETLTDLLLQRLQPPSHITHAPTIRQRHSSPAIKRADLLAMSVVPPYADVPIRLNTKQDSTPSTPGVLTIAPRSDLILYPRSFCDYTLRMALAAERGSTIQEHRPVQLDSLAKRLGHKLLEAENAS